MITKDTEMKVLAVIDVVSSAVGVVKACEQIGIPHRTFFNALNTCDKLAMLYTRARAESAELLADNIIHVAYTERDPMRARNIIIASQWCASKFNPKRYGEKIQHDHNVQLDLQAAINEGNNRVAIPMRDPIETTSKPMPMLSDSYVPDDTGLKPVENKPDSNDEVDIFS